MFELAAPVCDRTVSVWYAILFGSGDACVEISAWSVLQLLLPFAAAILLLQYVVNRVLFGRRRAGRAPGGRRADFRPKAGQRVSKHLREPAE